MAKGFRQSKKQSKRQAKRETVSELEGLSKRLESMQSIVFSTVQQQQMQITNLNNQISKLADLVRCESVDTPAELGDHVIIDFLGRLKEEDGSLSDPFMGGYGPTQALKLDESNGLLPDFTAGLIGTTAGIVKELEVVFPENYRAKDLAGKKASFKVEVLKVLKDVSNGDVIAEYSNFLEKVQKEKEDKEAEKAQEIKKAQEAKELEKASENNNTEEENQPGVATVKAENYKSVAASEILED